MGRLIRYLSLRHARRHKMRTFFTVSGVALGVAVVIAIQASNHSVIESFRRMIDSVAGRTTLQLSAGPAGVPEDLWEQIEKLPYVRYVTPVIQTTVRAKELGNETILLLGIDFTGDEKFRDYSFSDKSTTVDDPLAFLNDPDAVLLSDRLKQRYRIREGDLLTVSTVDARKSLKVRGFLKEEGPAKAFGGSFMIMDIFAAQALWGKEGRFDRFDLITAEGEEIHAVRTTLNRDVGADYTIEVPKVRGESAEKLLASFQTGMNVGGFAALLVGLFLIYNTMQIAIAQRRREIGIARALGALKSDMVRLFIGEALTLGIVGSVAGVVFGLWLARFLLAGMSEAVSMHFLKVNADDVYVTPWILFLGFGAGVVSSVISAIGPARRAASISPVEGIRMESESRAFVPTWSSTNACIAYGLGGLALLLWFLAKRWESILWGYASQLSIILAFAFLAPTILRSAGQLLRGPVHRFSGPEQRLAFDQLQRNVMRSAITVAAIMVGFSMVVEISVYVFSLKQTLHRWISQTIPADIFVTSGSKLARMNNQPIREGLADVVLTWPEVDAVDRMRMIDVRVDGTDVPLLAHLPEVYMRRARPNLTGITQEEVVRRLDHGPYVLVATNFLRRFKKEIGDSIHVQAPNGQVTLQIIGAMEDYTSDRGLLIIGRKQMKEYFGDTLVDAFDVYLKDKKDVELVRQRILKTFGGDMDIFALTNVEMKKEVFRIVEETYKVVHVMEIIAVLVSLLGVANSLLASILERTRELGVLRAIGATRKQIARMIVMEGGYLALGGMSLGIIVGIVLAQIIFTAIIPRAIGWDLALYFPYGRIVAVSILGLIFSMLAAYFPARHAARLNIVTAIEYE